MTECSQGVRDQTHQGTSRSLPLFLSETEAHIAQANLKVGMFQEIALNLFPAPPDSGGVGICPHSQQSLDLINLCTLLQGMKTSFVSRA